MWHPRGVHVNKWDPLAGVSADVAATFTTSKYVVPTGRVKVPAGRYVVPTGKDKIIVSAGRTKVIPAGSTILVLCEIDHAADSKLHDKNADESWEIIENLALYDHEG
ncbi:hypothetical protein Tco_0614611 [Tanacetum coccineum]